MVSEAGQELDLDHGIAGPVRITDHHGRALPARQVGPTRVRLGTRRGQTVVVRPAGSPLPDRGPVDVRASGTAAPWGLP